MLSKVKHLLYFPENEQQGSFVAFTLSEKQIPRFARNDERRAQYDDVGRFGAC
ncbi:MAG: hypothetical protein M1423_10750 [Acidobacteria bacterium]|nr:hypothetical protein [Acidobacteriota bacterium]